MADLFDPVAGVVGEYDGADHGAPAGTVRTSRRAEDFRRVGLEYLTVTGPDVPRRDRVVQRILSTRARALFLPEHERAWTIDPPPGWPVAPTLDGLLAQRAVMAEVHEPSDQLWNVLVDSIAVKPRNVPQRETASGADDGVAGRVAGVDLLAAVEGGGAGFVEQPEDVDVEAAVAGVRHDRGR